MNDYADVDRVIQKWVEVTASTLFTEWEGKPLRFFHVPGKPQSECFQVVVFSPSGGTVSVQAASVDTNDDSEFLEVWEGEISDLDALLGTAVAAVQSWKDRNHTNDR
ncbi:hypothetical protein [Sphingomonas sp.]|jgi:hypothetical protein|uniref:hypothetical protein n=1 Tax=Sphingomonas sp. TaxID=28214 RepID=UPI002DE9DDA7|nr:hypothetical protein [Sphingomonas sp.]